MSKVEVKGRNFLGFEIEIFSESLSDIKKEIDLKVNRGAHFFNNAITTLKLAPENKNFAMEIYEFLKQKGIVIHAIEVDSAQGCNAQGVIPIIETKDTHIVSAEKNEEVAVFKGNLRNGQTIKSDGTLVVVGNVNPNSYVYATGDIYVLGKLYGIPHAGYGLNNNAIIFAFDLNATQIRIGNLITRSPDEKLSKKKDNVFEVAYVDNNQIFISSYYEWLKLNK